MLRHFKLCSALQIRPLIMRLDSLLLRKRLQMCQIRGVLQFALLTKHQCSAKLLPTHHPNLYHGRMKTNFGGIWVTTC